VEKADETVKKELAEARVEGFILEALSTDQLEMLAICRKHAFPSAIISRQLLLSMFAIGITEPNTSFWECVRFAIVLLSRSADKENKEEENNG